MQEKPTTEPTPLTDLREALFKLDYANDRVLDAERELANERQAFADKLVALGPVWLRACEAAQKIGERVPDVFREGGLLISFYEEGEARAERLPEGAASGLLWSLAEKAGEKSQR